MSFLAIRAAYFAPTICAAFALSNANLEAAVVTARTQHWQAPTIRLADPNLQAIELKRVDVQSEVFGAYAWTRVELTLFNPNGRQLEGELHFPLLDGQTVSGFALDINGQLRDAVSVPKARGQEIFEDIRRRQVDPALLEATAGNQYKLRVYPVPPRGERRVMLAISERLQSRGAKSTFRLPIGYGKTTEPVHAEIVVSGARSEDIEPLRGANALERTRESDRVVFRLNPNLRDAPSVIELAVKGLDCDRVVTANVHGKRYFVIEAPLADEPVRRVDPKHIALIWDASGSARQQSRALSVLDAFFRSLKTPARVSLLVVRNDVAPIREFRVTSSDWSSLANALQNEAFDGSSNFDRLPIPADVDLTIFVSDGLATEGKRNIAYQHHAPLIALNSSAVADAPRLRRIAEASGGRFVDASSDSANAVAQAMWRDGWRIVSITSPHAQSLVAPSLTAQNGSLQIAGVLIEPTAKLKVKMQHPTRGTRELAFDVTEPQPGKKSPGLWPAQLWAQWRIAELSAAPHLHAKQIARISSEHGLVGPNSSLIVLELAADYAQYELSPPPELRAEVDRLLATRTRSQEQSQSAHIERMVKEFDARQRWWERTFSKDTRKPIAVARAQGAIGEQRAAQTPARSRANMAADRDSSQQEFKLAESTPMRAPAAAPAAAREASADVARPAPTGGRSATTPTASIQLKAWSPDTPYLSRLRAASDAQLYATYLDERESYRESSAFFLDVAAHFFERQQPQLALRILSNLAEMNLENRQLLRLYGYRLIEAKRFAQAVALFERVSDLAPNEPQSWRDLGLAHADNGSSQAAVDALWIVVSRSWHSRFQGVNLIALAELNAIVANAKTPLETSRIDRRLLRNMPLDLRIVMAWDTDDTDIDLHVIDPNGETSSYGNRLSFQGAAMSPDATGGYGPEEFALRDAKRGNYGIEAQFYGHRQQVLSAGTTVMVRVTTGFGTPQTKDQWITLRLTRGKETAAIGEVTIQ